MDPQPGSPTGDNDFGFQIISNSIRQIWTNATTAPGKIMNVNLSIVNVFVNVGSDTINIIVFIEILIQYEI